MATSRGHENSIAEAIWYAEDSFKRVSLLIMRHTSTKTLFHAFTSGTT
jgi:hypothetical protein